MERRFQEYVEDLGAVVGNDARRRGLSDYMTGLLLPGERKSMEPIAERLESGNVSRRHQAIQHFVSEASWKDGPVRERVLGWVVPVMQKRGAIEHWIVDDTTLLKSGQHSVGVAIQYSGLVGTTANCQSLVSLSLATEAASMPVACDLYLPEDDGDDAGKLGLCQIGEAFGGPGLLGGYRAGPHQCQGEGEYTVPRGSHERWRDEHQVFLDWSSRVNVDIGWKTGGTGSVAIPSNGWD
jgi:hypothetical protein